MIFFLTKMVKSIMGDKTQTIAFQSSSLAPPAASPTEFYDFMFATNIGQLPAPPKQLSQTSRLERWWPLGQNNR
jgi:hypothetical protein